ncbi:hypothetical protein DXK94_20850 [Arthrobacter sp. RT-1]|uniref:glycoside hydrolase family 26 protein n=1 Tax=Arthrobacter sp. RT-1 TaxID=2292263 RepID=UPI000E1EF23F|nr:hypothetical protein [Arthrobacter sp. RT-1]RDV08073.1 hypothetical protein DXK94_20850 [Arthrobacter sp. RT-1]
MSEEVPEESRGSRRHRFSRRLKGLALPVIVGLVFVGIGGAVTYYGINARPQNTDQSIRLPTPVSLRPCEVLDRAALVPASGALFGVNLDMEARTLAEYSFNLGHTPAVTVVSTGFPYNGEEKEDLQRAADQIRAHGQTMLLTLEPVNGLDAVTEESAATLARDLAAVNNGGVPVFVRFAPEMNGNWTPWGQQPARYIAAFRTLASAVHAQAPGSAMMWAPDYGGGYPSSGGQFDVKPGTADFTALDTDADGALTANDDPYAPYYPGDDAVDWVGMSLYHWGSAFPWGENELPEANKFASQLTGNYLGANGDDTPAPDFYEVYGVQHGKPVAIPETAALFNPAAGGETELAIKQAWWGQLFDPATAARFPQLKMVNWFERDEDEVEVNGRVDWTVTKTAQIREAFTAALPDWLHYGPAEACAPRR